MKNHPYDFKKDEATFLKDLQFFIQHTIPPGMKASSEQLSRGLKVKKTNTKIYYYSTRFCLISINI